MILKFKDKCDSCGNYDYLKSYDNKCLCKNCTKILKNNIKKIKFIQMTIFDLKGDS